MGRHFSAIAKRFAGISAPALGQVVALQRAAGFARLWLVRKSLTNGASVNLFKSAVVCMDVILDKLCQN